MSSLSFLSISSLFSLWAVFLRYPSIWHIACRNGRERWHGGRAGEGWRSVSFFKFELVVGRGWEWRVWVLLGRIGSVHSRCASLSLQIEMFTKEGKIFPENYLRKRSLSSTLRIGDAISTSNFATVIRNTRCQMCMLLYLLIFFSKTSLSPLNFNSSET